MEIVIELYSSYAANWLYAASLFLGIKFPIINYMLLYLLFFLFLVPVNLWNTFCILDAMALQVGFAYERLSVAWVFVCEVSFLVLWFSLFFCKARFVAMCCLNLVLSWNIFFPPFTVIERFVGYTYLFLHLRYFSVCSTSL